MIRWTKLAATVTRKKKEQSILLIQNKHVQARKSNFDSQNWSKLQDWAFVTQPTNLLDEESFYVASTCKN